MNYDWWFYKDYLMHHGIDGQKWGVKHGPPYPLDRETHKKVIRSEASGTARKNRYSEWYGGKSELAKKRLSNAKTANFDRWGKEPSSNVLYLTGLSGSGKSTVAGYLADTYGAEIINLDSYLSPMSQESKDYYQNKKFNKFLDKNVPNWKNTIKNDKLDFKIVDQIADAVEQFGSEQHGRNKVIAEGVQILDDTLHEKRSFYSGKPAIILKTNSIVSNYRGSKRDSENILDTISLFGYRLKYSHTMSKHQRMLEKEIMKKHTN